MEKKKWIQDVVKHKGALRKEAKREHLIKGDEKLSMTDLNKLEKKGGKTAKRAVLAKTLRKFYGGGEPDEDYQILIFGEERPEPEEESEEPNYYDDDYASGGKIKEKVFIEYLNKSKGYKMDRKYFNSYQEAERWARNNFDKFNTDYIRYEYAVGGEIEWGEDLGDGFSVGNDVYITDSKSMYQGKTGFVSGLIGNDLLVTISENGNERSVFVSKKGVEKLDAPEFAKGGKVDFMSDEFESKVNDIFAKPKSTQKIKILPSTNRTKNAFGSLSFEQLSEIFNVELFGLNERETEKMLEELRDEWNLMSENERIGFLNANKIKFAYGGMTPGRYYQDNKGQEFRFVGESEGKLLFKDGEKVISKSEEDFEDMPQEKKLFKFFRLGGEMEEPEESQEYYASMQYAKGGETSKFWDNLDFTTRAKVLQHLYIREDGDNAQIYEYYNSINKLSYSDWDKLPKNIKSAIEKHEGKLEKGGYMAKGGTFDSKVNAIAKKLEGKPVPAPYRKEYGTRYDKVDAKEAATRIVGNMRKMYGE